MMKLSLFTKFYISIVALVIMGIIRYEMPVDIRNQYLKDGITYADIERGNLLLKNMENAYGGRDRWESFQYATFTQRADWYGRIYFSNWDTLPQIFELECELGSTNSRLKLLNGQSSGAQYEIVDCSVSTKTMESHSKRADRNLYARKMIYKSYWFQFPFRVREAEIVAYGGEAKIKGTVYQILYITWGSEYANRKYDQFMLYLNSSTYRIEYLHFTIRERAPIAHLTAYFDNFKAKEGFTLPYSQYVRYGSPKGNGIKIHENHYMNISFRKNKSN